MKSVIVAKNRVELGIGLVIAYLVINLARWLAPEGYGQYVAYAWWVWLAGLLWLVWSIVAPLLLVKKINLDPALERAFDDYHKSIEAVERDRGNLARAITDAETQQRELMRLFVGFVNKAKEIQAQQQQLATRNYGRIAVYDADFSRMLQAIGDNPTRESTLNFEMGVLGAFEQSMLEQAEELRTRVMNTRALITQQRIKLEGSVAEVPFLKMERELESCLNQLPYRNSQKALPASGRALIGQVQAFVLALPHKVGQEHNER